MCGTPNVRLVVAGSLLCLAASSGRGDDALAVARLIDQQVDARLDSEGYKRAPPADDAEFLRRAFLDLHGVVPPADRAAQFLKSSDQEKRAQLIDELLASPRFGEYWADVWRGRLISPLAGDQRAQNERFAAWLADRFNRDPWDQTVSALLTASGTLEENPAVTYLIEGRYPLSVADLTDLSTRYFLGIRLNCAQCHDHPFVKWKQDDYWGMAAFFVQIQTPGRPKTVYLTGVKDNLQMTPASLRGADMIDGFRARPPTFLGGEALEAGTEKTLRRGLARWLTSPENPYFARATVNRMWWHFFGRGIVNPVDDMHAANPPSHPELLEALSRKLVESGFDLKFLCRAILNSRRYQQTSRPGGEADAEGKLFARMSIKVLTAGQLYDSLVAILGPPVKGSGVDARLGPRHEFLQFFSGDGDPDPTRYDRGIPQLLRLMNSPQFAGPNLSALVSRVAAQGRSADEAIDDLFLTILSRRPTEAERKLMQDHLQLAGGSLRDACREIAWALLLSSEFSLNH